MADDNYSNHLDLKGGSYWVTYSGNPVIEFHMYKIQISLTRT